MSFSVVAAVDAAVASATGALTVLSAEMLEEPAEAV
jgi:hypothetical protein